MGRSGLVNAPTGCGKTFAVFLGWLIRYLDQKNPVQGLQLLWISPLRALAKDIALAMEDVIRDLDLPLRVGVRNGDTPASEKQKQKKQIPEILIITPESLHILLSQKGYPEIFSSIQMIVADEWHELLGSKRGVQVELAISRIVGLKKMQVGLLPSTSPAGVNLSTSPSGDMEGEANNEGTVSSGPLEPPEPLKPLEPLEPLKPLKPLEPLEPLQKEVPNLNISIWALSATIGNLDEAMEVLLSPLGEEGTITRSDIKKKTNIIPILPDEIEKYPWAGHLGLKLAHKVIPIINTSTSPSGDMEGETDSLEHLEPFKPLEPFEPLAPPSSLLFINTRGMSEQWYHTLLTLCPELAGNLALHHGSIEKELRDWVEENLHSGNLKAAVCTASLDLGVDFRPVGKVIQVGSPKGVARFLQRAGRSGHQPDAVSNIYFLPTHSLELLESAALRAAAEEGIMESKPPLILCHDALLQYICTLAISEGFNSEQLYAEVRSTHCYRDLQPEEWQSIIRFLTSGGKALKEYDEFRKLEFENDTYYISNRKLALRHRMHIGTIVSDAMLKVKLMGGSYVGHIEEYFISRLKPGDVFSLAGRTLELASIREMTVWVKACRSKKAIIPSWNGGRMPLSANLGGMLRKMLDHASRGELIQPEIRAIQPLLQLQRELSFLPGSGELLIEKIETKDGHHLFVYPFEGRLVHEAMAALLAYRISKIQPISFSFAMNDYGFELTSDQPIPADDDNIRKLFSEDNLLPDIQAGVNASEMARRKFRDIAVIGGLIIQGKPGQTMKAKHLQSSASLLFDVFSEYDPDHLLLQQAYREVMEQQMDEPRLRNMLQRIQQGNIIIRHPSRLTPFCFPILVDSMREQLSSEKLEDRIRKMQEQMLK
jgi:ATP-dependent Lhr-like helicase